MQTFVGMEGFSMVHPFIALSARRGSPPHRDPDQLDQFFVRKGLAQEPDGAGPHGLFLDPLGVVRGHEDHRYVQAGGAQAIQDLQAGHPRHLHVDHGTVRARELPPPRKSAPDVNVCTCMPQERSRRFAERATDGSSSTMWIMGERLVNRFDLCAGGSGSGGKGTSRFRVSRDQPLLRGIRRELQHRQGAI